MEIITNIPFELDSVALMKHNRIRPDTQDAQDFDNLIHLAREAGNPKAVLSEAYVEFLDNETVILNKIRFSSTMLRQNLADVARVFPFVVTCGHEMDRVNLPDQNLLTQFWWDGIKESMLGSAIQYVEELLKRRHLLHKTSTMSPGSGDVDVWPIEQQRLLFALLGDVRGQIGVELTDSYLMIPNKTVSGIFFPTEKDFRTCQVCHRENCPSRSAPFDPVLWESIQ